MASGAGRGLVDRKHFERQMGCMAGFLNLFDRHQILARKRLPPAPVRISRREAIFMSFCVSSVVLVMMGCAFRPPDRRCRRRDHVLLPRRLPRRGVRLRRRRGTHRRRFRRSPTLARYSRSRTRRGRRGSSEKRPPSPSTAAPWPMPKANSAGARSGRHLQLHPLAITPTPPRRRMRARGSGGDRASLRVLWDSKLCRTPPLLSKVNRIAWSSAVRPPSREFPEIHRTTSSSMWVHSPKLRRWRPLILAILGFLTPKNPSRRRGIFFSHRSRGRDFSTPRTSSR